jgi:hypothetical protein
LYRYLLAAHAGVELAQYNAAFMFEKNSLHNREPIAPLSLSISSLFEMDRHEEVVPNGNVDETVGSDDGDQRQRARRDGSRAWTRSESVEEALWLYHMSSSQGFSHSMLRMGDLAYSEGNDFGRATRAYERASKMNNAEAMFSLGWMHARGWSGVKPDANLAKRHFDAAKTASKEAILPATMAVFLLRYHGTALHLWERWASWQSGKVTVLGRVKSESTFADDSVGVNSLTDKEIDVWGKYGDIAVLTVLFGVLAGIVNVRQRRLVGVVPAAAPRVDPDDGDLFARNMEAGPAGAHADLDR